MAKEFKVEAYGQDGPRRAGPVFDRAVLAHHTMDDLALADEIMKLFLEQLTQLETAEWSSLDLAFQMHTLRGAAAAVGANQLQSLAEAWADYGNDLEDTVKSATQDFRKAAQGL